MGRRFAWMAAVAAGALALTASARTGHAGEIVGILDLSIEGVSQAAAKEFETAVEEALAGTDFDVSPRNRLNDLLRHSTYVAGCSLGPCVTEVFRLTKVRLVLVGRIKADADDYSFVLSLLDTRSGTLTSQVAETCPLCTVEEARSALSLAVVALTTGTGSAKVVGRAGPVNDLAIEFDADLMRRRLQQRRRTVRRGGWVFTVGAAVGAIAAGVLYGLDQKDLSIPVAAGSGVAAISGVTMLVWSASF